MHALPINKDCNSLDSKIYHISPDPGKRIREETKLLHLIKKEIIVLCNLSVDRLTDKQKYKTSRLILETTCMNCNYLNNVQAGTRVKSSKILENLACLKDSNFTCLS